MFTDLERQKKTLELDSVLELLSRDAVTEDGKKSVLSLCPENLYDKVSALLSETDAAYKLLARFSAPSFSGVKNISESISKAKRQASLG